MRWGLLLLLVVLETHAARLPVFRNHPVNPDTAIVIIHGVARDADYYFETILGAALAAGRLERTLVIAPHFKTLDDKPAPGELYWTGSWKHGARAVNDPSVPSFDVLDTLVAGIKAPRIVVTGHSAGGQLVSRYIPVGKGGEIEYIIANPSSYLYLDAQRPREAALCPDYDRYPYGLQGVSGADEQRRRFRERNVTVFLGEEDTKLEYLDTSCEAMRQGKDRLERGVLFHAYVARIFRPRVLRLVTVPGVGHDNRAMYQSREGLDLLFR